MLVRGDFAVLHALYESVDTGSEATVLVDASVHYFYTKGPNVRGFAVILVIYARALMLTSFIFVFMQAQLLLELLKSLIDKEVDSTGTPCSTALLHPIVK